MAIDLKSVGERIREARKANKLTQNQLAEILEVSPAYISDIEMGKVNFGITTFMKITEALQISADRLLCTNIPEMEQINNVEITNVIKDLDQSDVQAIIRIIKDITKLLRQTHSVDNNNL